MLSALYKYSLKSRRWYLHIWWHSVTVALINAWILYRRDLKAQGQEKDAMPLRRFQASVGSCLISAGKARVKPGRPLSLPSHSPSPHSSPPQLRSPPRKRLGGSVPPDVRQDGVDHFPSWAQRQRCKHCRDSPHFTHMFCEKCKVHLCLNKDRNCFIAYHLAK